MEHKVLVVEGHPVYINKLEGFLRGLTLNDIVLADSGIKGIESIKKKVPDLMIVSSILPDMDGLDFCGLAYKARKNIATIVLTGLFEDQSRIDQFQRIGVDDILDKKEKDMGPLQNAIEKHLLLNCY